VLNQGVAAILTLGVGQQRAGPGQPAERTPHLSANFGLETRASTLLEDGVEL